MKSRRDHIAALLSFVQFADPMKYTFHIYVEALGTIYLQASYPEADSYKPDVMTEQWTRKWHIADDATDSQIIQTAFKLCLTSTEHRCREAFKYKGVRVYGPHYDVEDLVKLGHGKGQWQGAPGKDFKW